MKKVLFVVLLIVSLFFVFSLCASAEGKESDKLLENFENIIPEESGVSADGELSEKIGIEALLGEIITAVSGEANGVISFFLLLMGFAVMFAVGDVIYVSENAGLKKSVSSAVAAVASVSIFSALYGIITSVGDSLSSVVDFFSSLIPILTAVNTAQGSVATASVQAVGMNFTLALLEKFCTGALLPLVFAFFSLAMAASVGEGGISSVAKGLKNLFMWGIGIICTVLAAAIGLQSLLASAQDTAALRAARYAVSGMIPIVGTTVSSALSTLAGGLAFVKSTVGVGAIAVILFLVLCPIVALLLYRLAFSASLIFLEMIGSEGGVRCFSAFRAALDSLIAVYSMSVIICIVEIVIFIKNGGGAV